MGKRKNNQANNIEKILYVAPVTQLLSSINLQVDILAKRGVVIKDFDCKDKVLRQIKVIGGIPYFLAENADTHEDDGVDGGEKDATE